VAYYRAPTRYVVFVFVLWFFTPFVRRVVDMHHGFQRPACADCPRAGDAHLAAHGHYRARELRGALMYPFVFMLTGVLYGFFIGVLKNGLFSSTYALLTWVGPISFSMHLILNWRTLPALRKAFLDLLQWTVPLLGAYASIKWCAAGMGPVLDGGRRDGIHRTPVPFGFRAFGR